MMRLVLAFVVSAAVIPMGSPQSLSAQEEDCAWCTTFDTEGGYFHAHWETEPNPAFDPETRTPDGHAVPTPYPGSNPNGIPGSFNMHDFCTIESGEQEAPALVDVAIDLDAALRAGRAWSPPRAVTLVRVDDLIQLVGTCAETGERVSLVVVAPKRQAQ